MDEIQQNGSFARKAFMMVLVLAIVLSPFFYHLISFLLYPVVIPVVALFAFVYFTGLTNFEQRRMIILSIIFSVLVIGLYQGYVYLALTSERSHSDIHLNIAIWLVQVLMVILLMVLYKGVKTLRKLKELKQREEMGEPPKPSAVDIAR